MNYIVLDFEFNQAFPFKNGRQTVMNPECPFEIIQIGAVKLDEKLQFMDRFNFMIKPKIYPRIHPFVEKITGITMNQLKDSLSFPEAYDAFLKFIGPEKSVLCTWGIDDIKSLFKNVLFYNLNTELMTDQYINVQNFATRYLHYEQGKSIGLKNAVTELNLEMESAFHNALYDAEYTAKVFRIVCSPNLKPDTFQILDMTKKKKRNIPIDMKGLMGHFEDTMERELSPEERMLIKTAYKLGRNRTYDIITEKRSIQFSTK